jgi:hypothetical protein
VRIAKSDSGHGMRKEVLNRAFEAIFTTEEESKGTRLGLSGVQNFLKRAGGFAAIESRVDDGSTVCLYLPRAPPQPDAQPKPALTGPFGDGEVVLVVDDDDRVREVTMSGSRRWATWRSRPLRGRTRRRC